MDSETSKSMYPGDSSGRGAKLRLFAVLAGVMLVAAVLERSLDPAFRQWLRTGGHTEPNGAPIDTRLPPTTSADQGSFVAQSEPPPTGWDAALSRVQDDTLFLRPAEREAWRLMEERLGETEPAELQRQSVGEIGFTQLFEQPVAYRGRVVTIRGRVMYASRVDLQPAGEADGERFALWIMPAGGPTLPIVVYVQSLPRGFPQIEKEPGGQLTKLREDVTVTGILLKRGSYHATDGPRTAPVILSRAPEWKPPAAVAQDGSRQLLGPRWLWPTVGAALAVALVFVAVAAWFIRPAKGQGRGAGGERLAAPDFSGVSAGPSTGEAHRQMERERKQQS